MEIVHIKNYEDYDKVERKIRALRDAGIEIEVREFYTEGRIIQINYKRKGE